MTAMRLGLAVLWLLAGAAVAGGLFWELLQVPESSVWMVQTPPVFGFRNSRAILDTERPA